MNKSLWVTNPDATVNETANAPANASLNALLNAPVKLTEPQQKILDCMKDNSKITYAEMGTILKKDITTMRRNIKRLKEMNLLKRIGSYKTGH